MNQVKITYYGIEAIGANVTEAKRAAGERIEKIVKGDYTPLLIQGAEYNAFVYNTPNGWEYHFYRLDRHKDGVNRLFSSNGGYDSQEDCIQHACAHLAQANWDRTQDTSPLLDKYPTQQREFTSWCQWQRRYTALIAQGKTPQEAHAQA